MGHSDISVTMNTYTHLGLEDAVDEMNRMQQLECARKEQEALMGKTERWRFQRSIFGQDDRGKMMPTGTNPAGFFVARVFFLWYPMARKKRVSARFE